MRNLYKNKLIAICGSSGKTTLKHITSQILPGKLLFTKRSFNLKLSICCTLLFLNNDIDYVIIECGHNVPGEMDDFGRLLKPDYVIYSKIDEEHMSFFKTMEVIRHEQAQILYYTSHGVVCDEDYGEYLRNSTHINENLPIITEDVCKIENTNIIHKGVSYDLGHNYFSYGVKQSIAKIILLCEILNIKLNQDAFQNLSVPNMRGNIIKLPKHYIYDLSFNLNIGSLKNVIEFIEHNKETVDFIYGHMAESRKDGNKEALEILIDCSYINRIYTCNIEYDHEKCEVFNYEDHKEKLLNIMYIHGSKMNHMIGIVGRLIDYYTGQEELSPMLKHL